MFNVLTDDFKKNIEAQYKKRKIIVWFFAVIFLQVIFLIFVVPSYIYLHASERDLLAEYAGKSNKVSFNVPNSIEIISSVNSKISVLSGEKESNAVYFLVNHVVSLKNAGIHINEFVYTVGTATTSSLVLRGNASNRDVLLLFSKKLEADALFENVDLPVSSFAKDKNIDFSLSVKVKN